MLDHVIALMGATATLLTAVGTLVTALRKPRNSKRSSPSVDAD